MPNLYPLRFEPLFRRYLWGGRRLATALAKPIGEGHDYAESWELVDRGDDQSIVSAGPLAGRTLSELVREHGTELFGRHAPPPRFPLLWKFLDAHKTLSVQVHPNDARAAQLDPPDLGKTEAWVVLAAEPGSLIYAGLRPGIDHDALARAVATGDCESCLHRFTPQIGDCIFLPAGTVHALGAGLLVGEIQQTSDTTYRLFDWNRVGADGRPRELHVEAGLQAVDFDLRPVDPQVPQLTDRAELQRLIACDKFVLDRWTIASPTPMPNDDRFHILVVLEGQVVLPDDPLDTPLVRGETALLPASRPPVTLQPIGAAVILDAYLP